MLKVFRKLWSSKSCSGGLNVTFWRVEWAGNVGCDCVVNGNRVGWKYGVCIVAIGVKNRLGELEAGVEGIWIDEFRVSSFPFWLFWKVKFIRGIALDRGRHWFVDGKQSADATRLLSSIWKKILQAISRVKFRRERERNTWFRFLLILL